MTFRPRALALTLALTLAALGLASCANDPADLTRADSQVGPYTGYPYFGYDSVFSDPYYGSDVWPFYPGGRFGGGDHFAGRGFHSMGGFHSGGHGRR